MIDKTVNVPIPLEEISHTIEQLPRRPSNACIIPVQLKRMKSLKNAHKKEYVDCHKIVKAIETMKNLGNPYYKDISVDANEYFKECNETINEGFSFSTRLETSDDHISSDDDIDNLV